jgi:hypothetical protein
MIYEALLFFCQQFRIWISQPPLQEVLKPSFLSNAELLFFLSAAEYVDFTDLTLTNFS